MPFPSLINVVTFLPLISTSTRLVILYSVSIVISSASPYLMLVPFIVNSGLIFETAKLVLVVLP